MVNETPEPAERDPAEAARELSRLREQTMQARGELRRLRRDIAEAQGRLERGQAAELLEANEQLVMAVLRARTEAAAATAALNAAARPAQVDALTELPNRLLLLDRLTQAIANAERHGNRVALLFVDLDNFKQINDALGHAVGDQVLILAARRLEASVRAADTVSRHGGDEFLILLTDVSEPADAANIAEKVLASLAAPSRVADHVLRLTASIGIGLYPDDGATPGILIERADAAMYRAKRRWLGGYSFCGDMDDAAGGRIASLHRPLAHPGRAGAEHERRYAELREANQQLVLAALGAQELQAAAERARRRQTELLAVVAHELRNPLNPIRAAAALLVRVDPHQLPRLQTVIERQVLRVSRLASDLLDVSRASTGKLRLEMELFDLESVVAEAVDACRPAMDLRMQHLRVQWPPRALRIHGDPTRIAQVFSNLLDNASKYTPDGGEIGISVVPSGDSVVVTVSDNGIGMTTQALSDVFEPFVQEPHAIDFHGLGLGLGLTVVRELVTAHGGSVTASSNGAGQGSRVVVTMPLAAPSG
jgi:diguanylate cyclase (GGDEF)-like protein